MSSSEPALARPMSSEAALARPMSSEAALSRAAARLGFVVFALTMLVGCPRSGTTTPPARPAAIEVGRTGASLRGVAADETTTFVALAMIDPPTTKTTTSPTPVAAPSGGPRSVVEARRAGAVAWSTPLRGSAGPIVRTATRVAVVVGGNEQIEGTAVRGSPALAIAALDVATGTRTFLRAFEASDWVIATSIAAAGDDILVGGSFQGGLRVGSAVVTSGGRSDGFIARLSNTGDVEWLVRLGGPHADAVQGVAVDGERIAITGTVGPHADLQGELLLTVDDKTPYADGFVAELDADGRQQWTATFGSKLDDSVAGVAFDGKGRVAVAANAREVLRIGSTELVAQGPADGFVAYWTAAGTLAASVLLGGRDFDGLRAITAVDGRIVVGGFFSGTLEIGPSPLVAGGGDDSFIAALEGDRVTRVWPVTGDGREEIVALATVRGGFAAGIVYTAKARVDDATLAAPRDPMSGAAVVVRPVR